MRENKEYTHGKRTVEKGRKEKKVEWRPRGARLESGAE